MRGRFAPSPTGAMHVGNARTALLAWLAVRRDGGQVILRVEDLDRARITAGAEAHIAGDLAWLGLTWDEGPDVGGPCAPYRQSGRQERYDAAIETLLAAGRAFLCACSRADIARAASAPHDGEEGPRYPGICRDLAPDDVAARVRATGRMPAVRFRGGGEQIPFDDDLWGRVDPLGAAGVDDFVLRRTDGVAAYQLAVAVDDAAMKITHVVRGYDLLSSTPRQIALFRALDMTVPRFAHVPLVLAPGGERLAKRTRPASIADLRAQGISAGSVVGAMAASAGLCPAGTRVRASDLAAGFAWERVRREPAVASTWTFAP